MAHTRIKYTRGGRFEHEDLADDPELRKWHLRSLTGDGEFTACGNSIVDYDHVSEVVEKGKITCTLCIETIKFYKSINL